MTWIDFLAQYLALVLASLTVFGITLCLGYYSIKYMINKAMQSKEIVEFKEIMNKLRKEGEKIAEKIDKMLNPDPTKKRDYQT